MKMKMDVVEKKENPFLKRIDLMLSIDHTRKATPKRDELEKMIADKFKSVPEKVEIVYIFSEAGLAKSKVKARVWKEKIVVKKEKKKEKKPEKPKKEAKTEEKKEEPKKEQKPPEKPKETKVEEDKKPEKEDEKK